MRHLLHTLSLLLPLGAVCHSPLTNSELLQQLQKQEGFDYLLILGNSGDIWSSSLCELPVSKILLQHKPHISYNLHRYHSSNVMSIVFIDESAEKLMDFLTLNLRMWTTQPLLLILRRQLRVEEIFEWCWQQKQLLNVLAIYEDFEETGLLFSYTPFPVMQFEERRIDKETNPIVLPRLQDLRGHRLPIMIGGSTPRLIVYRQKNGELIYGGYVGHLRHCFELKYNCRLIQSLPLNESFSVPGVQLDSEVQQGKIPFALAATYTEPPVNRYTYPFELVNWCLMLPVPGLVQASELYTRVLDLSTFLITLGALIVISALLSFSLWRHGYPVQSHEFLLHNNCLRGALGQSFNEVLNAPILVRGVYLEICVLGFLLTAWYNSYFSAYITSAPRVEPFSSLDHILKSNFKIVIWAPEYQKLVKYKQDMQKYTDIFQVEPDFQRFLAMRDSFNTRFGYMMSRDKWSVIHQRQKVFRSPLFTFRDDLCMYRGIPVAFPVALNSVFREPLDRLIGEVTATGLMAHWHDMAFSEMITAGKLTLADLGQANEFRAMQLIDLNYILIAAALMLICAFVVFLIELLLFYFKKQPKRHPAL